MNDNKEQLQKIRHTLAHLTAAAVRELWPGSQNAIGPAIDDGFYQDFEIAGEVSNNDLLKIEKRMRKILPTWKDIEKREVGKEEALKEFEWNTYKTELINEFAQDGKDLTFHNSPGFVDLCKGGHVEHPNKEINPDAFKLTHVAGAYWRGDEKNKMLTRIYGVAFETKEELEKHLAMLEEAKKRDHRKLGKDLDLFIFSDLVGKGLPLYLKNGATLRRILERFVVDEEIKRGYIHVITPDIAGLDLYRTSGHYPYYKDSMYAPIKIDDEEFMLRPMTCPHHFQIYDSKPRSYRELPMRIAELAKLYRYEQSGELSGLVRVRSFTLADAHIVCADKEQAGDEIDKALDLIEYIAGVFGLKMGENYWYRLSLGDRTNEEKYFKDDESWDEGESILRNTLDKRKAHYIEAENEAAFYGPKIDVQMKNVLGKEDTAFTVQYDFCMPGRFKLKYIAEDGTKKEPLVIHRSSIGCIERVMAFLIEHFAGAFPLWLSPVQVKVLPISDKFINEATIVMQQIKDAGMRVEIDDASESIGKKIREAEMQKIPYIVILGEKEIEAKKIAVRKRGKGDLGQMDLDTFIEQLKQEVASKAL